MNCKTARHDIALYAGNDLDALSVRELRRHLLRCSECNDFCLKMVESVKALQAPSRQAAPIHDSVWPGISSRLSRRRAPHRSERFNGWAPALAVVASCMIMLFVTQRNAPVNDSVNNPGSTVQPIMMPAADEWSTTPGFHGLDRPEWNIDRDYIDDMRREMGMEVTRPSHPVPTKARKLR
ncbi:MAG: anti-sigma factor [Planctomycetaceae bacterium]